MARRPRYWLTRIAVNVTLLQATPAGFQLAEVVVRLARPDERVTWDALMNQHHYLGFNRLLGAACAT